MALKTKCFWYLSSFILKYVYLDLKYIYNVLILYSLMLNEVSNIINNLDHNENSMFVSIFISTFISVILPHMTIDPSHSWTNKLWIRHKCNLPCQQNINNVNSFFSETPFQCWLMSAVNIYIIMIVRLSSCSTLLKSLNS